MDVFLYLTASDKVPKYHILYISTYKLPWPGLKRLYSPVSFHSKPKHSRITQNATKTAAFEDLYVHLHVFLTMFLVLAQIYWLYVPLEIEFSQIWLWCCCFSPTTHGEERWVMMPPADKQRNDTIRALHAAIILYSSKRWTLHPCQNNLKLLSSFTSTKTLLCRIQDIFQKKQNYILAPE